MGYIPIVYNAQQTTSPVPIFTQTQSNLVVVIVQADEPTGVQIGTLWYDTDATP